MSYIEYKAAQEAEAKAFLETMKAELSDYSDKSYGERKGYEFAAIDGEIEEAVSEMDIFTMLASSEIDAGYWGESTQEATVLEEKGQFNVIDLDRWTKGEKKFHPVTGEQITSKGAAKLTRGNFSREHAEKAWKLAAIARAKTGYEKGAKEAKVRKVSQKQRRLALLANKVAAAEARKARS